MATNFFEKEIELSTIPFELANGAIYNLDLLRLDQVHTIVAGNKWFKLKYNIEEALNKRSDTLLSFGGAYSNHLHALAYAGKLFGLKTIGFVRGDIVDNPTLQDCKAWGMELKFVSRVAYREKTSHHFLAKLKQMYPNAFIIPEGGDNDLGQKGCEEIVDKKHKELYDTICVAIGTGTTFKGIRKSTEQNMLGFCALKNGQYLNEELLQYKAAQSEIYFDQHFGGFGKFDPSLLSFMTSFKKKYGIELDLIYNAKMFYKLQHRLMDPEYATNKVLVIHTGGTQGNRSQKEFNLRSY
jgi:1-aminocyclopropane-1-carboxylate deaminase